MSSMLGHLLIFKYYKKKDSGCCKNSRNQDHLVGVHIEIVADSYYYCCKMRHSVYFVDMVADGIHGFPYDSISLSEHNNFQSCHGC